MEITREKIDAFLAEQICDGGRLYPDANFEVQRDEVIYIDDPSVAVVHACSYINSGDCLERIYVLWGGMDSLEGEIVWSDGVFDIRLKAARREKNELIINVDTNSGLKECKFQLVERYYPLSAGQQ